IPGSQPNGGMLPGPALPTRRHPLGLEKSSPPLGPASNEAAGATLSPSHCAARRAPSELVRRSRDIRSIVADRERVFVQRLAGTETRYLAEQSSNPRGSTIGRPAAYSGPSVHRN